jgi:hypothetical protein
MATCKSAPALCCEPASANLDAKRTVPEVMRASNSSSIHEAEHEVSHGSTSSAPPLEVVPTSVASSFLTGECSQFRLPPGDSSSIDSDNLPHSMVPLVTCSKQMMEKLRH